MGRAVKNSLEIIIKQVRLEGGFERGGRITVEECLRQIVPDRWASIRKALSPKIRHISSIRHLLTTQAAQTLVCFLVLSRLDYCNSLLLGCPQYLLDKLQKVQNAAARLVCRAKKSDHIHPILETLHWLPVTHRIQYKISTICFNSISGTAPQYLSDLLQPYTPARQLRSASDTRTFVTPPPLPPTLPTPV